MSAQIAFWCRQCGCADFRHVAFRGDCRRGTRIHRICLEREGQYGLGHRYEQMGGCKDDQSRPTAARDRLHEDQKYVLVAVGDDDTIQMIDTGTDEVVDTLPSGPDPELFIQDPTGKILYVANEDDNTVTIIDIARRAQIGDVQVGVEPEGMGISPDGKILVNTSETTNMAHFIDTETHKVVASVLVDARPRFAMFKEDGSELWVSSEVGGTVSVIDPTSARLSRRSPSRSPACGRSRYSRLVSILRATARLVL